jgi:hypothetical protein
MFWGCELDSSGSGQGPVVGSCEHDSEPSGSVKGGEFLNWVSDCSFVKEGLRTMKYLEKYAYH